MSTHRTYYNYRGRKPEYDLTIDPSNEKKMEWTTTTIRFGYTKKTILNT